MMANNVVNFGPSRATARKFAATAAARRGGVSRSLVRSIVFLGLAALASVFVYLFVKIYSTPAPPPAAPPMGQWSLVKDEEVARVKAVPRGGALRRAAGGEGDAEAGEDADGGDAGGADAPETTVEVTTIPRRPRRIVLATNGGRINTGVWPNWGQESSEVTLNWAAAGVKVRKTCPTACIVAHEGAGPNGALAGADAVIVETVNIPKFGIPASEPLPWPAPKKDNPKRLLPGPAPTQLPAQVPLTGVFYYEPANAWPGYTMESARIAEAADLSLTPSMDSTLPVTLICPWGRDTADFLKVPARADKKPGRLLAYFNEHGVAPAFRGLVDELFSAAGEGIHSYQGRRNRALPPEADIQPYQLSHRLDLLSTYKFVLVTEATEQADYIEPELSHALVAGAVPVYLGAPNFAEFVPGPRAVVNGRAFSSGSELWAYLSSFEPAEGAPAAEQDDAWARYLEFHAWKKGGMDAFMRDEMGQGFPLGTGQGVSRRVPPAEVRVPKLEAWAAKPAAKTDGAKAAVVPTLAELKAADPASAAAFDDLAADGWRAFRRHLDHCVHYAECRICELVTLLT